MAEGGGDHPLRQWGGPRPQFRRDLSRDDIGNQARVLVTRFIHDRMQTNGMANAPQAEALIEPGTPTGPPMEHIREVADALKKIGDELDGDDHLQRLIDQVSPDCQQQTFLNVAREVFADGHFNWGRVVTLFYFAYKMAVKAMERYLDVVSLLKTIIEWVVNFIVDYVAPWIIERGGWEAILEHFGTPFNQALAIFISGILTSIAFILWRSR